MAPRILATVAIRWDYLPQAPESVKAVCPKCVKERNGQNVVRSSDDSETDKKGT